VSHLNADIRRRAEELVALYPEQRSALIPLCHLAQEQDGWLRPEAVEEIAELCGVTAAEVQGTATFYDMLHTEPVGTYVVSVCTNIACMLGGALELLEHAESALGVRAGGTTGDGVFTLEESECLADCDRTPCVQVCAPARCPGPCLRTAPSSGCGAASAWWPTGAPSWPNGRRRPRRGRPAPRRRPAGRSRPDGDHRRP
jgi:NADH:ubiquinone oxidoreductase subunit E